MNSEIPQRVGWAIRADLDQMDRVGHLSELDLRVNNLWLALINVDVVNL